MRNKRGRRPAIPGTSNDSDVAALIRVDHAGEYGAVRIYEGQLAVFQAQSHRSKAVTATQKMFRQEQQHLSAFDKLINERRVRPTALEPVWRVAGFALGAATALIGEKAAMACTAAVEDVIDEHYGRQIAKLGNDTELKQIVTRFRTDEIAHRNEALAHGAESAPGYKLLTESIKAGCRLAIRLSERL